MPMMTPAKDLPPEPLQTGQEMVLWPWPNVRSSDANEYLVSQMPRGETKTSRFSHSPSCRAKHFRRDYLDRLLGEGLVNAVEVDDDHVEVLQAQFALAIHFRVDDQAPVGKGPNGRIFALQRELGGRVNPKVQVSVLLAGNVLTRQRSRRQRLLNRVEP
jgi:hypothetical protein